MRKVPRLTRSAVISAGLVKAGPQWARPTVRIADYDDVCNVVTRVGAAPTSSVGKTEILAGVRTGQKLCFTWHLQKGLGVRPQTGAGEADRRDRAWYLHPESHWVTDLRRVRSCLHVETHSFIQARPRPRWTEPKVRFSRSHCLITPSRFNS
jgi:hypothetical protein